MRQLRRERTQLNPADTTTFVAAMGLVASRDPKKECNVENVKDRMRQWNQLKEKWKKTLEAAALSNAVRI